MELRKLPTEIFVKILSYCSGKDLISFSSMCREFKDMKRDVELIYKLRLVVPCDQMQDEEDEIEEEPNVQIFDEIAVCWQPSFQKCLLEGPKMRFQQ
jgi:F-box-like